MRAAALLLAVVLPAGAATCDEIRAGIDAKVRAAGVTQFRLDVVDAAASAPGRNVGSCDRGAKKILYVQGGPGATAPAAPKPAPGPIVTECKDGRVVTHGDCRK